MQTIAKTLAKGTVATLAAGAMAVSAASPAFADTRGHDRDGISAGDVIAGALVIGGIAAIAAAASKNNNNYAYDRGYGYDGRYGDRYDYRGSPRDAVDQCVRAAQSQASRYGNARVTRITEVKDRNNGWQVKGQIVVNGDRGYDRYGYGDRYGSGYGDRWGSNARYGYGYSDDGSFKCKTDRGRIADLDFSGLRGL